MAIVRRSVIEGIDVEVEVSSSGEFYAHLGEHGQYRAETLAKLDETIKRVLKKATSRKAIEVTFINIDKPAVSVYHGNDYIRGRGVLDAILRGYTKRTNTWLLTVDGKKSKAEKGYSQDGITPLKRFTPAEHLEWKRLEENRRLAALAIEDFIGARKLDADELFKDDE